MEEWQHHIKHTDHDQISTAWCGADVSMQGWYLTDVDHALYCIQKGTRIQPCPACLRVISGLLGA